MIDLLNHLVQRSWNQWTGESKDKAARFQWIISSNGGTALHSNVLMFGFKDKKKQPVLVAKVCRLPEYSWTLEAEYSRLVELWQILGTGASAILPKPLAYEKIGNDYVFIANYLSGSSLLKPTRKCLKKDPGRMKELAFESIHLLKFLNRHTLTPFMPEEKRISDFRIKADLFNRLFTLNQEEFRIVQELTELIEAKTARATNKLIVHGDFWHGNLIRDNDHGKLMLVDWQFACWSANVSYDVYLFLLVGALTAAPYGPEENRAGAAALILKQWQSSWINDYIDIYGISDDYVLLDKEEGMLACCIEKAVRPVLDFSRRHKDDVMWSALFRELVKSAS